jgi:dienelactone hydrolase
MRILSRIFLLVIGLASSLGATRGRAGGLVQFPNLSDHAPSKLLGYLARPDSGLSGLLGSYSDRAGPSPAVVVLHGCSGISSRSAKIADQLASWGYLALTVDSLGPRGMTSHCGGGWFPDQAFDAYAALRYLAQLDFVDPTRVAVFGQSMGGAAALNAVDRELTAQYFNERFRAAIAYYPGCSIPAALMTTPTLVLKGEADDWTPPDHCREMVAHSRPDGATITLIVYPAAYHAFDVAELKSGARFFGHWLEYNEPAARDAEQQLRAFLATHLNGALSGQPATSRETEGICQDDSDRGSASHRRNQRHSHAFC